METGCAVPDNAQWVAALHHFGGQNLIVSQISGSFKSSNVHQRLKPPLTTCSVLKTSVYAATDQEHGATCYTAGFKHLFPTCLLFFLFICM